MLHLVKPDIVYKNQYIEMLDFWTATGEKPHPWVLQEDYSDFNAMVRNFEHFSQGINIPAQFVPNTTYWAFDIAENKMIGAVNIRHYLNDLLVQAWGHIGYGVRPDERKKGNATRILGLALDKCKALDMDKVLLGCYKDNIASSKTIMKNGGVLNNEIVEDGTGKIIQRYWVDLNNDCRIK